MAAFVMTNCLPTLRHIRQWQPDVVHAHFAVPTGIIAWLARVLTRTPYVLTVHLGDVPGAMPETEKLFQILKPFTIPIWKGAACITAATEHIRQLAQAAYNLEVIHIPNGIDLDLQTQSPPEPKNPPRLVFMGRFTAQKNPLFLLEALKLIDKLPWELNMVGDGPLLPAVKERIAALGLQNHIHLHGWVSLDEVTRVMQDSDILLMPSRSEGLSIVGIKALAHGLAILGSDIEGIKEILVDGVNGIACPVDDQDAFARGLQALLGNAAKLKEMKQASRALASNFDLNRNFARYEEIFQSISSGHEIRLSSLYPG
jgi:glycosyltransferase involved in cell wall biosynthesis